LNRRDWILTAVAAVLLTSAFSPLPFGFLSVFALVPFFRVITGKKNFEAFRAGYVLGFLWSAGTLYWIGWPTVGGLAGALLVMPLHAAFFALFLSMGTRHWGESAVWTAPLIWVALEVIGSHGQLAFPWNALGNTFSRYPLMIQPASIFGVYGISFGIVLMNVFVFFTTVHRRSFRKMLVPASMAALLFALQAAYGWRALSRPEPVRETLRVGLVQGNIDAYKKWTPSFIDSNFAVYDRMTRVVAAQNPELIVWPETATPCYLRHKTAYWRWIQSMVDSFSIPLMTGTPDYAWSVGEKIKTYNAAFMFEPDSQGVQYYYKKQLVPFAEKVPYVERIPRLGEWINRLVPDTGEYSAGDSTVVFSMARPGRGKAAFSVAICFESIFPELVSRFAGRGAQFLVVITNDGWFGNTSGPYQHAAISILRAVENRRWVVRCANTGISEFIDPFGRVVRRTRWNQCVALNQTISLLDRRTFYTGHASLLSAGFAAAGFLVCLCFLIVKKPQDGLFPHPGRKGA
jgi:apolipoprotein N-acyltransferase